MCEVWKIQLKKKKISLSKIKLSADLDDQKDECCTHWGLKRWVYGIKEYLIDSLLCSRGKGFGHLCGDCFSYDFERVDEDRAYISDEYWKDAKSSDCCIIAHCSSWTAEDPVVNLICCPLATITHLLCLPYSCCFPNKPLDHFEDYKKQKKEHEKREEWMRKCGESGSVWRSAEGLYESRWGASGSAKALYEGYERIIRDRTTMNQRDYNTYMYNYNTTNNNNLINQTYHNSHNYNPNHTYY